MNIRSRTTILGAFLKTVRKTFEKLPEEVETCFEQADNGIDCLEQLADTFSPLANRSFKRRKRFSNLEDNITRCFETCHKDIEKNNIITVVTNATDVNVAVDPGELDAILLNLISNSIYWLTQVPKINEPLNSKLI